jgi:hypothetical protein
LFAEFVCGAPPLVKAELQNEFIVIMACHAAECSVFAVFVFVVSLTEPYFKTICGDVRIVAYSADNPADKPAVLIKFVCVYAVALLGDPAVFVGFICNFTADLASLVIRMRIVVGKGVR